jgi:hypothetical protein
MTNLQFFCLKHYFVCGSVCFYTGTELPTKVMLGQTLVLMQMTFLNNVRKVGRLVLSRTSCMLMLFLVTPIDYWFKVTFELRSITLNLICYFCIINAQIHRKFLDTFDLLTRFEDCVMLCKLFNELVIDSVLINNQFHRTPCNVSFVRLHIN